MAPSELIYLDYSPNIEDITAILDHSLFSVRVEVIVERPCAVYCGIFAAADNSSAITVHTTLSTYDVLFQKNVVFTLSTDATFNFTSVVQNVAYDIYCMTTTLDGQWEMSLANVLDTQTRVSFPCCRQDLTVEVGSKYLLQSNYAKDSSVVFKFESSLPIVNEVQISVDVVPLEFYLPNQTFFLRRRNLFADSTLAECTSGVVVVPSHFTLSQWTLNLAFGQHIEVASKCPGAFLLNITAYEVVSNHLKHKLLLNFPNNNIIEIVTNTSGIQAPVLMRADFVSDGNEIELRFDSFTDNGGEGEGSSYVFCNLFLQFEGASSTLCHWPASNCLTISHSSQLHLGDNITLLSGVVSSAYLPSAHAAATTLQLGSALTSFPVVHISSPSVISPCSIFSLDLRASSGAGGRAWKVVDIVVTVVSINPQARFDGIVGDVAAINAFYREAYLASESTDLPLGMLFLEEIYFFHVKLCNFLDICSKAVHRVEVKDLSLPSVDIVGKDYWSSLRTDSVRLTATPVYSCNGTDFSVSTFKTRFSPVYTWQIFNTDDLLTPIYSLVLDDKFSSVITVAPYTLSSNNIFKIVATLNITEEGIRHSSSDSCHVIVSKAALKASVVPSGYVTILFGESLTLNASGSFDSDLGENSMEASSSLVYNWTCTLLEVSKFALGCGDLVRVDDSQKILTLNSTRDGFTSALYRITLSITTPMDARIDTTFVEVYVEADCCSKVVLPPVGVVNTQTELTVDGYITTSLSGTASWSLLRSDLDLNNFTLSPLQVTVISFFGSPTNSIAHLHLPPNVLSPGIGYTFQLKFESFDGEDFRAATVVIATNDVPQPGAFVISPAAGEEAKTAFQFSASLWTDSQLPLSYRFGYYHTSLGTEVTLKGKTEDNTLVSTLPRGNITTSTGSSALQVHCFVEVFDNLGAFGLLIQHVVVNASALNSSELAVVYDLLEDEVEVEDVLNADDTTAVVDVNCTASPDCFALNRDECSVIDNTCGACLEGNYLGAYGHANTFCFNNTIAEEGVEHCFEDNSCGSMRRCANYTCTRIAKVCSEDCVHGFCLFRNTTSGMVMSECFEDDHDQCSDFCLCEEGFNGDECSVSGTAFSDINMI